MDEVTHAVSPHRAAAPLDQRSRPGALRLAGVLLATLLGYAAVTTALTWGTVGPWRRLHEQGADFGTVLVLGLAALAWLTLSWLAAGMALVGLAALPGVVGRVARAGADRATPAVVRRLAATALGVGLMVPASAAVAVSTGPATMAGGVVATARSVAGPGAGATPSGLPDLALPAAASPAATTAGDPVPPRLPDLAAPAAAWTPAPPAAPRPPSAGDASVRLVTSSPREQHAVVDEVVVRRGDTLWDVAARHLGPDATAAEIAAAWPRWYAANRAEVGPDPDLLLPGQVLRPPARAAHARHDHTILTDRPGGPR